MITRPRNIVYLLLAACCLVSVGGVVFINRAGIAQQLQDWNVIPQPEKLTELSFTDHAQLPKTLASGSVIPIAFTVHNLEHQPVTYHYKIIAKHTESGTEQPLGNGTFMLDHDATNHTTADITIPALGPRISIRVDLYYQGKTPGVYTQSINYWLTVSDMTNNKANP